LAERADAIEGGSWPSKRLANASKYSCDSPTTYECHEEKEQHDDEEEEEEKKKKKERVS